jgi:hypothetical protein
MSMRRIETSPETKTKTMIIITHFTEKSGVAVKKVFVQTPSCVLNCPEAKMSPSGMGIRGEIQGNAGATTGTKPRPPLNSAANGGNLIHALSTRFGPAQKA